MKACSIFYGEDEFSLKEALRALLDEARGAGLETVTRLEGRSVALGQLEMACNTVPFLSERRVVLVEGLLERFEDRPGGAGRGGRAAGGARGADDEEWARLPGVVQSMPATTVLVLSSGALGVRNPLLLALQALADVRRFPMPKGAELDTWITQRAARHGGTMTREALRLLESFSPSDMRHLDNEIAKLATYAQGLPITPEMVTALTHDAREASIFAMVDAVMEGKNAAALRLLRQLLEHGSAGPYITTMLARQSRMLVMAKSLRQSGGSPEDLPRLLGASSDYVVRKVIEQSRPYTLEQLKRLHTMVLEADAVMKDGTSTEELALETFVVEAAGLLRGGAERS